MNSYVHVLESNWLREMQFLVNRKKNTSKYNAKEGNKMKTSRGM